MEIYKRTARKRQVQYEQETHARRETAWAAARQAAQLLKERFGATRVIVFGSLAHSAWFHTRSDIDLAVEGVSADDFIPAWAALDHQDSLFEIDLIRHESAPAHLRESIERGIDV